MIKAILWDIDGTVLDFLPSERYAIRKCFSIFGLGECTDEMMQEYSYINKKHWHRLETGSMTKEEMLVSRFEEFFSLYKLPVGLAESFNSEYQIRLGDKVFFNEGAEEVLESLLGRYILCAATNGTKTAQKAKLNASGLNRLFDYIFISEDIGYEKPDPRFFEHIFSVLGISNHKEVMIVGDGLTSDIKGGIDSGLITCWYNPTNDNCDSINPDYIIDSLKKVNEILNIENTERSWK